MAIYKGKKEMKVNGLSKFFKKIFSKEIKPDIEETILEISETGMNQKFSDSDYKVSFEWDQIVEMYVPDNPKKSDFIRISYMPEDPYIEYDKAGNEIKYADGHIMGLEYFDNYLEIVEEILKYVDKDKITHTKKL